MVPEVARSQRDSLREWANSYANDPTEGASEASFLLQRAARQFDVMLGTVPKQEPEAPVEEPKAG